MALAIVAFSYLLGILNIRVNAWVTGTCLLLEVAALLRDRRPRFRPCTATGERPAAAAGGRRRRAAGDRTLGIGDRAVGTALFSYNGFGGAVLLAGDMKDGGHSVHRAVLWSLALVVLIEIVPLAALLIGAPSLRRCSPAPTRSATC